MLSQQNVYEDISRADKRIIELAQEIGSDVESSRGVLFQKVSDQISTVLGRIGLEKATLEEESENLVENINKWNVCLNVDAAEKEKNISQMKDSEKLDLRKRVQFLSDISAERQAVLERRKSKIEAGLATINEMTTLMDEAVTESLGVETDYSKERVKTIERVADMFTQMHAARREEIEGYANQMRSLRKEMSMTPEHFVEDVIDEAVAVTMDLDSLQPTSVLLETLQSKIHRLEVMLKERKDAFQKYGKQIKGLYDICHVSKEQRESFKVKVGAEPYTWETIEILKEELARMKILKTEMNEQLIRDIRDKILEIQFDLFLSEEECDEHAPLLNDPNFSEELYAQHELYRDSLIEEQKEMAPIRRLYGKLVERIDELAKVEEDISKVPVKKLYDRAGRQLLCSRDKIRDKIIPKIQSDLREQALAWEKSHGKDFLIDVNTRLIGQIPEVVKPNSTTTTKSATTKGSTTGKKTGTAGTGHKKKRSKELPGKTRPGSKKNGTLPRRGSKKTTTAPSSSTAPKSKLPKPSSYSKLQNHIERARNEAEKVAAEGSELAKEEAIQILSNKFAGLSENDHVEYAIDVNKLILLRSSLLMEIGQQEEALLDQALAQELMSNSYFHGRSDSSSSVSSFEEMDYPDIE